MSASQIVPLTVTYTPSGGAASTATVLGQVLDNGKTNWIPATSGGAIYLGTSSAQGASETVVAGQSYYLSTGADVPQQVTISVTGTASSAAASSMGTQSSSAAAASGSSQTSASVSSAASGSRSSSMASAASSTAAQSSASASASASTSASSSSSAISSYSASKWLPGAMLAALGLCAVASL